MNVPLRSASVVAAALLFASCATDEAAPRSATPVQEPSAAAGQTTAGAVEEVTATKLGVFRLRKAKRHVRKLAGDIGVRVRASGREHDAKRYIARKLRSYGYDVRIQEFSVDGGTSTNVVAKWPGSNPDPFVMGAHMDTVPGSPGANDNASGVAVMLEMARITAGRPQAEWVRFVAFGAEEYGTDGRHHVGSAVYVNRLWKEGRARSPGMVSVDMVADGRPLLVGNSGIASDVVARTIYRRLDRANINVRYITLCDCSDHGPFEHAGIPAGFMYSGPEPNYHDPSDKPGNLRWEDLERTGRAARVLVKSLDRRTIRRFREG